MKALIAALALLAAACSSTSVIDQRVLGCEAGGDLMIRAGLQGPARGMERVDDRLMMLIEVSNNTHHEIVVEQIRVEQTHTATRGYRLDPLYLKVDRTIAEDDDYTFELPMTGRWAGDAVRYENERENQLDLVMSLFLGNGDVYRCGLLVPRPQ